MADPKLSVLDLATVGEGQTVTEALENSTRHAQLADRLGFRRYWVAEHHNMPGIASSSPPVLISHLAGKTSRIRVGSGGVMLPNHAPLVVAEQFGTLEGLHPGRIDLGIGRAPGTDMATAAALRRSPEGLGAEDFPRSFAELEAFFADEFPEGHQYTGISANPGAGLRPQIWLLGSSDYSAQVAAHLGLPFSYAHHFSPNNTVDATRLYREMFRPSKWLDEPLLMVAANVVVADTDDRAKWLAGPSRLAFARSRTGERGLLPSPESAAAHEFSRHEERLINTFLAGQIVGTSDQVREGLLDLADATGANELMATSMIHSPTDRLRSLELLALALPGGLAPPG